MSAPEDDAADVHELLEHEAALAIINQRLCSIRDLTPHQQRQYALERARQYMQQMMYWIKRARENQ